MIDLYSYQKECLEKTKKLNRVGFFLDMGLGKTFVGSEKAISFDDDILLVCQKSKIDDWLSHFEKFYKLDAYDLTKKAELEKFLKSKNKKIGVINYDLVWRRDEVLELKNFTLMLDESSLIQNLKTKRTKFILKLKAKNVILLSGTPTSGKYENLYSQMKLLGSKMKLGEFYSKFIRFEDLYLGGFTRRIVHRTRPYKNVEMLKSYIRELGAIFLKTDECLELPSQNFIDIDVKTTSKYKQFDKDSITKVDGEELVGDSILAKITGLRQLAGQYNKNKLDSLKELIESTNDRIIIFYNFNKELDEIKKIIKDKPLSEINGKKKDLYNYVTFDNSITLIQYQAGAMGLNLQLANKIIYFSPTTRSELYEQSKKRIHRIGQNKKCFYYLLKTDDSIEHDIYKALEKREDYTNALFKEN